MDNFILRKTTNIAVSVAGKVGAASQKGVLHQTTYQSRREIKSIVRVVGELYTIIGKLEKNKSVTFFEA